MMPQRTADGKCGGNSPRSALAACLGAFCFDGRRHCAGLELDNRGREYAHAVLVEVDDRVIFVAFDDSTNAVLSL